MYITPCKSICKIDSLTGVCIGCNRTRKEISDWSKMSEEQRMTVMKRLGYGKRKKRSGKDK